MKPAERAGSRGGAGPGWGRGAPLARGGKTGRDEVRGGQAGSQKPGARCHPFSSLHATLHLLRGQRVGQNVS